MKILPTIYVVLGSVSLLVSSTGLESTTEKRAARRQGIFRFIFPNRTESSETCTTKSGIQGICSPWIRCKTVPVRFGTPTCRWVGLEAYVCCPPDPAIQTTQMPKLQPGDRSDLKSAQLSESACVEMPANVSGSRTLIKRQAGAIFGILEGLGIGSRRRSQAMSSKPFILGGIDAPLGAWPFMAAIFLKDDTSRLKPFCGGALIDDSTVLTAAHCFPDEEPGLEYVVVIGDTNLGNNADVAIPILAQVSKVIKHEGYKYPIVYDDIALLKLSEKISLNGAAKTICLPEKDQIPNNLEGKRVVIIGWGHIEFGGRYAKTLQQAELPVVSNAVCDTEYKALGSAIVENLPSGVTDTIVCAGNRIELRDACQADSGGPMVMKDPNSNKAIIVGVISSGYECGRGVPGLYTRVTKYLDWIQSNKDK